MVDLNLSIAVGNYDRLRPLIDGAVQMDTMCQGVRQARLQ
jgi:hypothetical protein